MNPSTKQIQDVIRTVSLGTPDHAVGFVMWRLLHRYMRELDRELVPIGLTHLQYMTLIHTAWLTRTGEPVTQSELARFGEIQPMQVSHMVKTLEKKGLLRRQRADIDTRSKVIALTPDGLRSLRLALPLAIAVQRTIFGVEGKPGGALLTALLRRIHADK